MKGRITRERKICNLVGLGRRRPRDWLVVDWSGISLRRDLVFLWIFASSALVYRTDFLLDVHVGAKFPPKLTRRASVSIPSRAVPPSPFASHRRNLPGDLQVCSVRAFAIP